MGDTSAQDKQLWLGHWPPILHLLCMGGLIQVSCLNSMNTSKTVYAIYITKAFYQYALIRSKF